MSRHPPAAERKRAGAGGTRAGDLLAAEPCAGAVRLPGLIAGRTWHARPDSADAARFIAANLDRLGSLPEAARVKGNPVRTVYRVAAPGGRDLVVKHYHSRGLRDALKHLFVRHKARAEWRAALRMERCGIPVPRMLAIGRKSTGPFFRDACLVMEAIPRSYPAGMYATEAWSRERRSDVIRGMGALAAKLHASGVFHPDFHGGNVLAAENGHGSLDLYAIDLHAVRFPLRLGMRLRARSLAVLASALSSIIGDDRAREMLRSYAQAAGLDGAAAADLWRRTARERRRYDRRLLDGRARRCLRSSSKFTRERHGTMLIVRSRQFPLGQLLAAIGQDGPGESPGGIRVELWPMRGLLTRLRPSPARRAWLTLNTVATLGIPAPEGLGLVEDRRSKTCWLVTGPGPAMAPLADALARPAPAADSGSLAAALARTFARLHAAGVRHQGLAAGSIRAERRITGWAPGFSDVSAMALAPELSEAERAGLLLELARLPEAGRLHCKLTFLRVYRSHEGCGLGRDSLRRLVEAGANHAPGRR